MSASYFNNKAQFPDDFMLAAALGTTLVLFENIRNYISKNYGDTTTEWKFYGAKSGWVLKMLLKKKNLFFVIPCNGYFRVAFTLGEKSLEALSASDLPDYIKDQWKKATNHTEGRTVQFDMRDDDHIHLVTRHISIKLEKV